MAMKKIPKAPSGFIKKDDDQKKRGRGRGGRGRGKRPTKVPYTPGPAPDGFVAPPPPPPPPPPKKRPPPIVRPPDRMKGGGPINAHKQEAMSPCPKPRVRGY